MVAASTTRTLCDALKDTTSIGSSSSVFLNIKKTSSPWPAAARAGPQTAGTTAPPAFGPPSPSSGSSPPSRPPGPSEPPCSQNGSGKSDHEHPGEAGKGGHVEGEHLKEGTETIVKPRLLPNTRALIMLDCSRCWDRQPALRALEMHFDQRLTLVH
jgi:hypothetical protein